MVFEALTIYNIILSYHYVIYSEVIPNAFSGGNIEEILESF